MSILIKGMEIPKNCEQCPMGHCVEVGTAINGYGCMATLFMGNPLMRPVSCSTRPSWCPLIELPPHGRLIDADALSEKIQNDCKWSDVYMKVTCRELNLATTIIEAEKGEQQ